MTPYTPTRLHKCIRSHSVFVFRVGDGSFGSGVIIEFAQRNFVVSAAHVIKGDVDISLGILPHQSRFRILDKWTDDTSDIGFMELSPPEVKLRLSQYSLVFPVGSLKAHGVQSRRTTLALCGFPSDEAEITERGREIPATYLTVAILALEQWPKSISDRFDSSFTFVVPFGPKWGSILDGNELPRDWVVPFGMSGSGLWLFDASTEDAAKPVYSLGGIQHSWNKHEQVLLGTWVHHLIDRIAAHCGIVLPNEDNGSAPSI
jgi:hypothetical protein